MALRSKEKVAMGSKANVAPRTENHIPPYQHLSPFTRPCRLEAPGKPGKRDVRAVSGLFQGRFHIALDILTP